MKIVNILAVVGALTVSSSASAESQLNNDFEQKLAANATAAQLHAASEGKVAPIIKPYDYKTKLDVAKVVSMVRGEKTCAVVPAAMTYEDSDGNMKTITYRVSGECRQGGG